MDAGGLEERRAEIEDEVDTGELLPALEEDAGKSTEGNLVVRRAEAVEVGALADLLLRPQLGADLVELKDNDRVISRKGREAGE